MIVTQTRPNQSGLVLTGGGKAGGASKLSRVGPFDKLVEAPCRVFYRYDGERVFVLYVMRGEMRFRKSRLIKRDRDNRNA